MNPHAITREFEAELCRYTGAPYAVAVNSCTMALLLAVKWHVKDLFKNYTGMDRVQAHVEIPKRTYVSVPQSIIHAGARPTFRGEDWQGFYQLKPLPVWDSARYFSSDMFSGLRNGLGPSQVSMMCVSFHASKILSDSQGGAILHDSVEADAWLRRVRFDGRTEGIAPKDDTFDMVGYHCYLSPDVAARLLWKLSVLPQHNEPLPNDDYPDLSLHKAFQ